MTMTKKEKSNRRIRKGDTVVAIAGNDKGKTGTVLHRVDDSKFVVQGINVRKKAVRRSEANPQGGFVEREMPIHASNLKVCDSQGKGVRLKARLNKNGDKELYYNSDGKEILHRLVKNES